MVDFKVYFYLFDIKLLNHYRWDPCIYHSSEWMEPFCHLLVTSRVDAHRRRSLGVSSFCWVIAGRKWFRTRLIGSFIDESLFPAVTLSYKCYNEQLLQLDVVRSGPLELISDCLHLCDTRSITLYVVLCVFLCCSRRPEYEHQTKTLIVKLRTSASVTSTVARKSHTRWPRKAERTHTDGWRPSGSISMIWVSAFFIAASCSF